MRRLALLALLLCLALVAGSARADTFAVVPAQTGPFVLPSFSAPNVPGSVVVPSSLSTPPTATLQLPYSELLGLWQRAGSAYGIPWQVLAAINKVESNFGRNMGPSSAGAIGWMQFMPSTWLRWGTDASGDGVADPWNATDAVYSAARYLAAAGGSSDLYRAVYAYNHADWYVQEVLGLAAAFGSDGTAAFTLDRLQQNLDAARSAVAAAGDRLLAAERDEQRAARVAARLTARANRASLLSDRLAREERAGKAEAVRAAAAGVVTKRSEALANARQQLARAQQASLGASFAPGASQLLGGPTYSGGYVFPVGGGPGKVFASHTHHDYPAVDIAAPLGSPAYALADSVVLKSWSTPDPSCGIGLTLRAFDGQVWTYCHLAVLDASVVPGASLQGGALVGLVGSTGDASGPHLHLQLQPPTGWPQQETWFASFAGSAFTWTDAGVEPAARTLAFASAPVAPAPQLGAGPVFDVLPETPRSRVVYFTRGS